MLGWFRRRWVSRAQYEAMTAVYETRIELMEAALARFEEIPSAPNVSMQLLERLRQSKLR